MRPDERLKGELIAAVNREDIDAALKTLYDVYPLFLDALGEDVTVDEGRALFDAMELPAGGVTKSRQEHIVLVKHSLKAQLSRALCCREAIDNGDAKKAALHALAIGVRLFGALFRHALRTGEVPRLVLPNLTHPGGLWLFTRWC